jgi:CheY-like chemotaxis protein
MLKHGQGGYLLARILVVVDDSHMRELLALHLGNAGYELDVAEDAVAAGYSVLRARPDLIISDINAPELDGFEFIALLRQERSLRDIPVILLSTENKGEPRGKDMGVVRYLPKPVRADTLLSIIAEHVEGGRVPIG